MRTAVVRVQVDPAGRPHADQLSDGMTALRALVDSTDIEVLENNIAAMPAGRREVQMLMLGGDAEQLKGRGCIVREGIRYGSFSRRGDLRQQGHRRRRPRCARRLRSSREITRASGDDGLDIVHVTLRKADLDRVPESRIHTALEASLNCEVHIRTT